MRPAATTFLFLTAATASALGAETSAWNWAPEGLKWSLRNLTYAELQQPSDLAVRTGGSIDNPEQLVESDLRADLSYSRGPLFLALKPRANVFWQTWTSGARDGEEQGSGDLYLQEWLVRLSATDLVYADYGLQNLQWGPSFLLSPSNPFNSRNGKENPYKELPSAYYARAIWTPSSSWTLSGIANVGKGEQRYPGDFQDTYALKVDYQFQDGYASLIGSYRDAEDADLRLGYYAGYNFTDSFLGYVEGSTSDQDSETLVGGSYTTRLGPTLVMEYYHNSSGDADTDVQRLALTRVDQLDWREAFLRKNYFLVQAYQQNVFGALDYVVRWVTDADDHSQSFNLQLEYGLTNAVSLFTVTTLNRGSDDSELAAVRDYSVMAGVELAF